MGRTGSRGGLVAWPAPWPRPPSPWLPPVAAPPRPRSSRALAGQVEQVVDARRPPAAGSDRVGRAPPGTPGRIAPAPGARARSRLAGPRARRRARAAPARSGSQRSARACSGAVPSGQTDGSYFGQAEVLVDPGLVGAEPGRAARRSPRTRSSSRRPRSGTPGSPVAGRARWRSAARAGEDLVEVDVERVAATVELVDPERLVVGVVEEALEAGVAHRVARPRLLAGAPRRRRRGVVDLDRAPRVVEVAQEVGEDLGRHRAPCLPASASSSSSSRPRRSARSPTTRGVAEGAQRILGRALERRQALGEAVQLRRRVAQVGEQRRLLAGRVVELGQRRPQLGDVVVEQVEPARDVLAALERGRGDVLGLVDEVDDLLAVARRARPRPARSGR